MAAGRPGAGPTATALRGVTPPEPGSAFAAAGGVVRKAARSGVRAAGAPPAGCGGRGLGTARGGNRQRLPRLSCSRSIASKRALKLPLPKPMEPCRSMISKKTVGRSWTGLVKICSR